MSRMQIQTNTKRAIRKLNKPRINNNGTRELYSFFDHMALRFLLTREYVHCSEIIYLKNQLELLSMKNKAQNHESRRVDNYIRDIEERNKDQEKLIRFLRKENKDYKSDVRACCSIQIVD